MYLAVRECVCLCMRVCGDFQRFPARVLLTLTALSPPSRFPLPPVETIAFIIEQQPHNLNRSFNQHCSDALVPPRAYGSQLASSLALASIFVPSAPRWMATKS